MTQEFFDEVPEEDAGRLTAENKRLFGLDLRDAVRSYDGSARDNVASTLVPRTGKGRGSTLFESWDDMLNTLRHQLSR